MSELTPVQVVVEQTVGGMGYELVDLEFAGRGLLRVFIDAPAGIRMEDCERVSHQLSRVLAVEHIDYERLEVSSPGLDRPLKKTSDFERFCGSEVTLKLRRPLEGRRNFTGLLSRDDAGRWALEYSDGDGKGKGSVKDEKAVRRLVFGLDEVERARLVPKYRL